MIDHGLKVVLVEPEIPHNAGNVARLCAAAGAQLHLARPLGFFLTDKHFKRAGMDYLKDVRMTVHDDLAALMAVIGAQPVVMTSGLEAFAGKGRRIWDFRFAHGMWIFFGKESGGLPAALLEKHPVVQIPMASGTRGLNVSTAAGIVLYEAVRQVTVNARG